MTHLHTNLLNFIEMYWGFGKRCERYD
jgi:hypothetical protein